MIVMFCSAAAATEATKTRLQHNTNVFVDKKRSISSQWMLWRCSWSMPALGNRRKTQRATALRFYECLMRWLVRYNFSAPQPQATLICRSNPLILHSHTSRCVTVDPCVEFGFPIALSTNLTPLVGLRLDNLDIRYTLIWIGLLQMDIEPNTNTNLKPPDHACNR